MSERHLRVFPSVGELQEAAATFVAAVLAATRAGHTVRIALSGGSTPRRLHELLAAMPGIDWSGVHVFFGDERTVGPDDPQSNYRMARESLLDRVPIPPTNVHRMHGEDPPTEAALAYEQVIVKTFDLLPGQRPQFDVIVLGMGADGHAASLFPGTAALRERERLVVANEVPQLGTTRLTLTYPVLNAARRVLFLVAGGDKAEAVGRVFGADASARPPAAWVAPSAGDLHWFIDAAAAAGLPPSQRA